MVIAVEKNNKKEKHVITQQAGRDIYNVDGYLTINNYIKNEENDLVVESKNYSEKHLVDYFSQLKSKQVGGEFLYRKDLEDTFIGELKKNEAIMIYGDPGIGKTAFIISTLTQDNTIYLSMKKFFSIKSILYLLNMLRKKLGLHAIDSEDYDYIIGEFEIQLQGSEYTFVIDDIERNPNFINDLLKIEFFKNKFVFLSRSKLEIISERAIVPFELPRLSDIEIKEFLALNNFENSVTNVVEIINLSKGNLLYLNYFIEFPLFPTPSGLEGYLLALYENLSEPQKRVLEVLSLFTERINQFDLLDIINKINNENSNIITFNSVLKDLDKFVDRDGELIEIHHPYFSEFLKNKLISDGIFTWLKNEVGETYFEKGDYYKAVLLLFDVNNDLIKDKLISVFPYYIENGLWDFAIQVLLKIISNLDIENSFEKAYSLYHLSNAYRLIGDTTSAEESLKKAIMIFKELDKNEWLAMCQVWRALDYVEKGDFEKVEELHKEIISYAFENPFVEATINFNISKFYIDLYEFESAIDYILKSLEIFRNYSDRRGIKFSLVNLSICLMKLDRLDEAVEYASAALELAREDNDSVIEGSALNTLTICNRLLNKLEEAEIYGLECIKVWNLLKQKPKLVMNLINLGNVYSDLKNYEKAFEVYLEGYEVAQEINLAKEQARAAELIAHILRIQGKYSEAFKYIDKSIELSKGTVDYYRMGEAYWEAALCYKALGEINDAIKSFNEASINFKEIGMNNSVLDAFIERLELEKFEYMNLNETIRESKILLNKGIITTNLDNTPYFLNTLSELISHDEMEEMIIQLFINSSESIKEISSETIIWFIEYCNKQSMSNLYLKVIDLLKNSDLNHLNTVALLINQSGNLISLEFMDKLIEDLAIRLKNTYFRIQNFDECIFTFRFYNNILVQIFSDYKEVELLKLALFSVIVMKNNKDLFSAVIENETLLNLSIYIISSEHIKDMDENVYNKINEQPFPIIFAGILGEDSTMLIIVREDYNYKIDLTKFKEEKVIVWFLMNLFNSVEKYFNDSQGDNEEHSKYRRTLIHRVLNLFKVNDVHEILDTIEVPLVNNLKDMYRKL